MAAGLKTYIWNNNLRSFALLAVYPFLFAFLIWVIATLLGAISSYTNLDSACALRPGCVSDGANNTSLALQIGMGHAKDFIFAYWPMIFTFVLIWFTIAYFFQGHMIRALSHAKPVTREEEPELYNLLENLCISRGMSMPKLEIIETDALNAFASGIDKNSYSITVTRGLLQAMKQDELEAVLGHELTHILNGDVRLLIISIIFTGMIGFFAQMVWSSVRYGMYTRSRRSDGRIVILMMVIAAILWLGYIATMFTRFALSRRREFMADAGSVELTKNPEAMMRALQRLAGKDRIPHASEDIALMCIENSHKFLGLMATHPPLEERIEAISTITHTPIPDIEPGASAAQQSAPDHESLKKNPWS